MLELYNYFEQSPDFKIHLILNPVNPGIPPIMDRTKEDHLLELVVVSLSNQECSMPFQD